MEAARAGDAEQAEAVEVPGDKVEAVVPAKVARRDAVLQGQAEPGVFWFDVDELLACAVSSSAPAIRRPVSC